jgi:hypothetical protein
MILFFLNTEIWLENDEILTFVSVF